MSWFDTLMPSRIKTKSKQQVPDGLWQQCGGCGEVLYAQELRLNQQVCPKCGHHHRIAARERLLAFLDSAVQPEEIGKELLPKDFLKFKDDKRYKDRIAQAEKRSGETEALLVLAGELEGLAVVAAAFEFAYMGGSMGSVVGERFVRGIEAAIARKAPFICFAASGGARMQEGLTSLMQMAKTSAALTQLSDAGLPFISVLTDPTMGGVSASLAMLGDVIVAEPNALIGFAGPRVIEQTVRETLPKGFQRAEFLLKKGAIDCIIDRRHLRSELAAMLRLLMNLPAGDAVLEPEARDVQSAQSTAEALTQTTQESLDGEQSDNQTDALSKEAQLEAHAKGEVEKEQEIGEIKEQSAGADAQGA